MMSCDSLSPGSVLSTHPPAISPPDAVPALDNDAAVLRLVHPLAQGAFSSVWLAEDRSSLPLSLKSRNSIRALRRQASLSSASRKSSRSARSTPPTSPPITASNSNDPVDAHLPVFVPLTSPRQQKPRKQRWVAVKITPRRLPAVCISPTGQQEEEERARIGFAREVEILKV